MENGRRVRTLAENLDIMLDAVVRLEYLTTCEKAAYEHAKEKTLPNIAYNRIKGTLLPEACHENEITKFLTHNIGLDEEEASDCLLRLYATGIFVQDGRGWYAINPRLVQEAIALIREKKGWWRR